jgi:hypothetical protein
MGLDDLVRRGARQVIEQAIEAELAERSHMPSFNITELTITVYKIITLDQL